MKKLVALALVLILGLSLCACGEVSMEGYCGTWVREKWIDQQSGEQVGVTIDLYGDGTFRRTVNNSVSGNQIYTGTWYIEDATIVMNIQKLVDGSDPAHFDAEGNLLDGKEIKKELTIIDTYNLEGDGLKYSRNS